MRRNQLLTSIILLGAGMQLSGFAFELDSSKETYKKNLDNINADYGMKYATLADNYTASLANLQRKVQAAGDLDNLKVVMAEMERFSEEKKVTENNFKNAFLDLKKLQITFASAADRLNFDKAKKIVILTEPYEKNLSTLQSNLTKQGNIDDANRIQEERQKVQQDKNYIWAKKIISESLPSNKAADSQSKTKTDRTFIMGIRNILYSQQFTFCADGSINGSMMEDQMKKWKQKNNGDISVINVANREWRLFKKSRKDPKMFQSSDWYLVEKTEDDLQE